MSSDNDRASFTPFSGQGHLLGQALGEPAEAVQQPEVPETPRSWGSEWFFDVEGEASNVGAASAVDDAEQQPFNDVIEPWSSQSTAPGDDAERTQWLEEIIGFNENLNETGICIAAHLTQLKILSDANPAVGKWMQKAFQELETLGVKLQFVCSEMQAMICGDDQQKLSKQATEQFRDGAGEIFREWEKLNDAIAPLLKNTRKSNRLSRSMMLRTPARATKRRR